MTLTNEADSITACLLCRKARRTFNATSITIRKVTTEARSVAIASRSMAVVSLGPRALTSSTHVTSHLENDVTVIAV